jgi:WhiB family redox-sensing transcriptional regulator
MSAVWMQDALCLQVGDGDMWWPGKGQTDIVRAAKKVCSHCPVRVDCLTWAIENHERDGIYGGMTPRERRRAAKARNAA